MKSTSNKNSYWKIVFRKFFSDQNPMKLDFFYAIYQEPQICPKHYCEFPVKLAVPQVCLRSKSCEVRLFSATYQKSSAKQQKTLVDHCGLDSGVNESAREWTEV